MHITDSKYKYKVDRGEGGKDGVCVYSFTISPFFSLSLSPTRPNADLICAFDPIGTYHHDWFACCFFLLFFLPRFLSFAIFFITGEHFSRLINSILEETVTDHQRCKMMAFL